MAEYGYEDEREIGYDYVSNGQRVWLFDPEETSTTEFD